MYSSFQWSVTETGDTGNVFSVHTTGTQTNQTYNGLRIQGTRPSGSGISFCTYTLGVTVTDSNGDTATASASVTVTIDVPFGGGGGGGFGGGGGGGGFDDEGEGLGLCLHYTVLLNTEKGLVSIK